MTRRFGATALAFIALAGVPLIAAQDTPAPARPTGIMAQLQGVWTMTSSNGQEVPASGQEVVTTVTNNRYEQSVNGQVSERGTFKIDESKKPMAVDVSATEGPNAGMTQLGIFQLNGKTLTVKVAEPGTTVRPTDLAPSEGCVTFVMVKK
ncbi:MAG TPA: TIGR03067 domain-containing protein [Vicinamibacterales bacterium]|nr:TIGR03067 domain-containing protein [Vicinamibacterales bacterium]